MWSIAFIDIIKSHEQLFPLTYTKPSCKLRVGILTIKEKWELRLTKSSGFYTQDYLSKKFPKPSIQTGEITVINGSVLPDDLLTSQIAELKTGQSAFIGSIFIAGKIKSSDSSELLFNQNSVQLEGQVNVIENTWDIFRKNGNEIKKDFSLIVKNRKTEKITDPYTITYGSEIFIEKGVSIKAAILNAENGPIYIGKNSVVSEGAVIVGPFAICENSLISIGAKIRSDTTIGPFSKVGGEVSNSVIQGYTSKGHDGFLGNSVLGEWCNLGAATNNSNLKNSYTNVKMWNYPDKNFIDTNLQFCGLIMGDYSKCGINTMFNTGTTVGIAASIFGSGYQNTHIPSFSWGGGKEELTSYDIDKMLKTTKLVKIRRNKDLTESEIDILRYLFETTAEFRN